MWLSPLLPTPPEPRQGVVGADPGLLELHKDTTPLFEGGWDGVVLLGEEGVVGGSTLTSGLAQDELCGPGAKTNYQGRNKCTRWLPGSI